MTSKSSNDNTKKTDNAPSKAELEAQKVRQRYLIGTKGLDPKKKK